MLKLFSIVLFFPTPARKQSAAPDLSETVTHSGLGTISSDPWAGWTLHEHLQQDA